MGSNDNVNSFSNECMPDNDDQLLEIQKAISLYFNAVPIVTKTSNQYQFYGELKLDNPCCTEYRFSRTAKVFLFITTGDLIKQMPVVQVKEPWMHKSADWHCYKDGQLCWELKERWEDKLTEILANGPPREDFVQYAISWCLESSICLICRHWYAHTHNLTEWPAEWKFWKHGDEGKKKYEQDKRKHQRKTSKRSH